MTQDEIIRMAREAGFFAQELHCSPPIIRWSGDEKQLERFAALVAAHEREKLKNVAIFSKWYEELDKAVLAEREACAKVCDAVESLIATIQTVGIPNVGARKVLNKACEDAAKVAAAIRARGDK